jgi:hypothetical protein
MPQNQPHSREITTTLDAQALAVARAPRFNDVGDQLALDISNYTVPVFSWPSSHNGTGTLLPTVEQQ